MATPKVVSERALYQRINRALAKDGERLRKLRGERWRSDLGDYYTIDVQGNYIIATYVDLEGWGREMGVLKAHESVADEQGAQA